MKVNNLNFNPASSTLMHIDLNSCFATVEQQANPKLRGRSIAVAAYTTPSGCILAPSVEAKKLGIKTGMRVKEGKILCPELIVLAADPNKYRSVHLKLRKIMLSYTNEAFPKSIDEFVLNLAGYPGCKGRMFKIAKEIKIRIKEEVGEWLTVSIGIAPNRFLAKTASGLSKPDGLDEINKDNFLQIYKKLKLTDLCGIKVRNAMRLNGVGVFSTKDFYDAPVWKLKAAFGGIVGYYWSLRLHGWEIDDVEPSRRSYGNSYALPRPATNLQELSPILCKLVTKMAQRLRKAGFKARGIHLTVNYKGGGFWHKGVSFDKELFDTRDIYRQAFRILSLSTFSNPVSHLAVSCFNLSKDDKVQLALFENVGKKEHLNAAVDEVNNRWGDFVLTPARMAKAVNDVSDRIAFGGVKELEEFTLRR